jgi:hypothetical protein
MDVTMHINYLIAVYRRRVAPGAALAEFVLMLPIMMFIAAFAVYLGLGLWKKQDTQVVVRHNVWRHVERTWWHHDEHSWPDWNGNANGPVGTGATTDDLRPRGTGEELRYLYDNAGRAAANASINAQADDYFRRVWNNLPGRHHGVQTVDFRTNSPAFEFLNGEVRTDYYHDSVSWTHGQEPIWLIAQYGPMALIKALFETQLADVPPEFHRMREEVLHAWFKEEAMDNWNWWHGAMP